MSISAKQRIAYVDWMRGLACALMFQTHCYDSWLRPAARDTRFFGWSQLMGTLPAPLFLFLAGVSVALVTNRMQRNGVSRNKVAAATIRRGAEIFGLGLLFRVQEFALGYPKAPWTDLLRVDILNVIGASIMLMGALCWLGKEKLRSGILAGGVAGCVAMLTPLLWTTWQPRWMPWFLESYVDGCHNLGTPQPWLFPLFPWAAFAFAGLAAGFFLVCDWARVQAGRSMVVLGGAGAIFFVLGWCFDSLPARLYPVYDFWHTSPNFFLMRTGAVLVIVAGSYAWCRWGPGRLAFSPLIRMGQASLLVYWVHVEFVYGRFSILTKHAQTIAGASLGLLIIFVAMTALAWTRLQTKGRGPEILHRFVRSVGLAPQSEKAS
jgi:uncharacterized membrane protein